MASRVTELLGLDVPIVLGPFGGGLSSVELAALVSNGGGLGSFGAQHLSPEEIAEVIAALRARTSRSFAVNLWVSSHDIPESEFTRERFDAAVERLRPFYARRRRRAAAVPRALRLDVRGAAGADPRRRTAGAQLRLRDPVA